MTVPSLFPDLLPVDPPREDAAESLSADRRRTLRQHRDINSGRHPLVGGPTQSDPSHTCGSCVHRVLVRWHNRTYAKCAHGVDPASTSLDAAPFASHGAATDCRAWWPGCIAWEATP